MKDDLQHAKQRPEEGQPDYKKQRRIKKKLAVVNDIIQVLQSQ